MQDNISPEERLLRLIRKGAKKSSRKDEKTTQGLEVTPLEKASSKISSPGKRQGNKFSLPGIFNLSRTRVAFSFERINRILSATLLILGIYLLFDFLIISSKKNEKRILALAPLDSEDLMGLEEVKDAGLEGPEKGAKEVQIKPVSYYSEPVRSRNLFTAAAATAKRTVPSPTFMEMVSKLRLQGIITGLNPQAVIEDSKTKQVYFLSPGERIGEIELKEILPGKVKLDYYGQEAELSL